MNRKRWITPDDFIETYCKLKQRGGRFIFSKLNLSGRKRTQSAFDTERHLVSNWWNIPRVKERWNLLVSGEKETGFVSYFAHKHLVGRKNIKVLSLGCGDATQEFNFARLPMIESVTCVDIACNQLKKAEQRATAEGFDNMHFVCKSLYDMDLGQEVYDVIMFCASLHHFRNVRGLLGNKIRPALKKDGLLLINEYVGPNRLQFPKHQIAAINQALEIIPKAYRKRSATRLIKNRYCGSGYWRMYIADPSECVDSAAIVPALHEHFEVVEEKPYGGNLLMAVFKDIAYHFVSPDSERKAVMRKVFEAEDAYLKNHPTDYLMGVYRKQG